MKGQKASVTSFDLQELADAAKAASRGRRMCDDGRMYVVNEAGNEIDICHFSECGSNPMRLSDKFYLVESAPERILFLMEELHKNKLLAQRLAEKLGMHENASPGILKRECLKQLKAEGKLKKLL